MKPSIKTVEKMFSTLNVDITDVDKCVDQIETIFEVTEIEAYELAHQLKESTKMSNEIIRTSEVVAATEVTVCEICGHIGKFEDFLWCNPCNVIHCTHNSKCIEAHIHCN